MGDVAELILEGVLCEQCGEYVGAAVGHPRLCTSCDVVTDAMEVPLDLLDDINIPDGDGMEC